jgi:transcription antitermination factor NusG
MTTIRPIEVGFQEGEPVVLARGTYPGTTGVFLHLREDRDWADVQEDGGAIRSHPVAWLEHAARAAAV